MYVWRWRIFDSKYEIRLTVAPMANNKLMSYIPTFFAMDFLCNMSKPSRVGLRLPSSSDILNWLILQSNQSCSDALPAMIDLPAPGWVWKRSRRYCTAKAPRWPFKGSSASNVEWWGLLTRARDNFSLNRFCNKLVESFSFAWCSRDV